MLEDLNGAYIAVIPVYMLEIELERLVTDMKGYYIVAKNDGFYHILVYVWNKTFEVW